MPSGCKRPAAQGQFGIGKNSRASHQVTVAAKIFGHGMHAHIGPQQQGLLLLVWRAIGVVDHHAGTTGMGDGGNGSNVDQAHVGVGWRFEVKHPGFWAHGLGHVGGVGHVHMAHGDTKTYQAVVQKREGATIKREVGQHLVTLLQHGPQGGANWVGTSPTLCNCGRDDYPLEIVGVDLASFAEFVRTHIRALRDLWAKYYIYNSY
jgi:hypothetical protein